MTSHSVLALSVRWIRESIVLQKTWDLLQNSKFVVFKCHHSTQLIVFHHFTITSWKPVWIYIDIHVLNLCGFCNDSTRHQASFQGQSCRCYATEIWIFLSKYSSFWFQSICNQHSNRFCTNRESCIYVWVFVVNLPKLLQWSFVYQCNATFSATANSAF
jgi:hypothetical protein